MPNTLPVFAFAQFCMSLSWVVYASFLPAMATQVGLPKSAVVWLLLLDRFVHGVRFPRRRGKRSHGRRCGALGEQAGSADRGVRCRAAGLAAGGRHDCFAAGAGAAGAGLGGLFVGIARAAVFAAGQAGKVEHRQSVSLAAAGQRCGRSVRLAPTERASGARAAAAVRAGGGQPGAVRGAGRQDRGHGR